MKLQDEAALIEDGHLIVHELANGKVVAVVRMLASAALVLVTEDYVERATRHGWNGWERRFCYRSYSDAVSAAAAWDGTGDAPGDWVKEKSRGIDRLNPRFNDPAFLADDP